MTRKNKIVRVDEQTDSAGTLYVIFHRNGTSGVYRKPGAASMKRLAAFQLDTGTASRAQRAWSR